MPGGIFRINAAIGNKQFIRGYVWRIYLYSIAILFIERHYAVD